MSIDERRLYDMARDGDEHAQLKLFHHLRRKHGEHRFTWEFREKGWMVMNNCLNVPGMGYVGLEMTAEQACVVAFDVYPYDADERGGR